MTNTGARLLRPALLVLTSVLTLACFEVDEDDLLDADELRIVGGVVAADGAWPWAAALVPPGGTVGQAFCGGALIDQQHVITAKHCVDGLGPQHISVVLDRYTLNATGTGVRSSVTNIYEDPDHDIAVIELYKTITTLDPIPVAGRDTLWPGDPLTTIGWGATSQGGSLSNELRQVDVQLIANADCNSSTSYDGDVSSDELCAGVMAGGYDSCQGDSGGPLMHRTEAGWHLVGVTSWGFGCAQPNYPGVYANVVSSRDFLQGFVSPLTPPPLSGATVAKIRLIVM